MKKLIFLATLLAGCSSTHSTTETDAGADAASGDASADAFVSDDAAADASVDAFVGEDAAVDLGSDASSSCELSDTEISVTAHAVEDADWSDEQCALAVTGTEYFDATLTSITADAEHNGIVLRIDRCPNADGDCRCDYTVANIGTDVATRPISLPQQVRGQLAENAISLQRLTICECAACPCASPLFFFAARAAIGSIPVDSGAFFGVGAATCSDGTGGVESHNERQPIEFDLFDLSSPDATVDEGQTANLEFGVSVRVLSSHEYICPACGGVGPALRSWAAWQQLVAAP